MRVSEIYVDLDDVLNNFTMSALKDFGCDVSTETDEDYPSDCGYDIVKAANKLLGLSGSDMVSAADFWNTFDRNFWGNIEKSREFHGLLSTCCALVGGKNVYILTAQVKNGNRVAECVGGKVEWMFANLPSWITDSRQYFIGSNKWKVARPWSLLIDDSDKNIEYFKSAGGQTITVPRAWNRLHYVDSIKYVTGELERMKC